MLDVRSALMRRAQQCVARLSHWHRHLLRRPPGHLLLLCCKPGVLLTRLDYAPHECRARMPIVARLSYILLLVRGAHDLPIRAVNLPSHEHWQMGPSTTPSGAATSRGPRKIQINNNTNRRPPALSAFHNGRMTFYACPNGAPAEIPRCFRHTRGWKAW